MTDDPLDRLEQAMKRRTPAPSDAARDRALRVAQTNFSNLSQGSAASPRHTSNRADGRPGFWKGVTTMIDRMTTRPVLLGTSALATLVLAVALTQQLRESPISLQPASPPAAQRPAPAVVDETVAQEGLRRGEADGEIAPAIVFGDSDGENRLREQLYGRQAGDDLALPAPERTEVAESEESFVAAEPMMESAPAGNLSGYLPSDATAKRERTVLLKDGVIVARPEPSIAPAPESDTEAYPDSSPSPLKLVAEEPVSTFSIDVDTASYAVVRSSLTQGLLPPRQAVRVEEMINYFDYDYPAPDSREVPFATSVSVQPTPWNEHTQLMHIGIQGYDLPVAERPPLNLVFLIDTSGSMSDANKLPLLIRSFKLLLDTLTEDDSVAIVTYAGSAGMVLEPTQATETRKILAALDRLSAGGSTAGGAGLQLAYAAAQDMAEDGEVSRVILATDGDFNVGISNPDALKEFIAERRDSGTYLSVLGFGRGNYDDATMQALAQNGNGTAAYIDTLSEAQKVLVEEASGALFPIAGDVKIQVEFNPAQVSEYRLIGYETRALNREDFNNDAVDAGEIGAGHTVTALYEITPKGSPAERIGDLRYAQTDETEANPSRELAFLKLRYKRPGEDRSNLIETPIQPDRADIPASETQFAAAVAGFGELLRGSTEIAGWDYDDALALASSARGDDPFGYRAEFLNLVRLAKLAN